MGGGVSWEKAWIWRGLQRFRSWPPFQVFVRCPRRGLGENYNGRESGHPPNFSPLGLAWFPGLRMGAQSSAGCMAFTEPFLCPGPQFFHLQNKQLDLVSKSLAVLNEILWSILKFSQKGIENFKAEMKLLKRKKIRTFLGYSVLFKRGMWKFLTPQKNCVIKKLFFWTFMLLSNVMLISYKWFLWRSIPLFPLLPDTYTNCPSTPTAFFRIYSHKLCGNSKSEHNL